MIVYIPPHWIFHPLTSSVSGLALCLCGFILLARATEIKPEWSVIVLALVVAFGFVVWIALAKLLRHGGA